MRKIASITLLFFILSANSQTNNSYSFSLEQAISHALANNYSAINAGRDIEIARQKRRETTATGLPQINAGIDYVNNFKLQQQGISGSLIPSVSESAAAAPQISTFAFGTKQSVLARSTLSQILFDGSYLVALQASKTYLKYYENAKRKTDVEIREMVTISYGNVLLAEESIAILNRNKTILEKTLSDTKETFKNGLIEEENVEQLQITLGTVNSNLNNNTRLLEVAFKMLKIDLGLDINSDLQLTDKLDDLTVSNLAESFAQSEFNFSNNVNYQMALNFEQQRTLEYKLQRSMALPTLSANLNFGYNSFDQTFAFLESSQKYYNYSNLGISLNIPIFSSFARSARTQQAKIALSQAKTQLTETEQRLKLQYEAAKSDYEFSIEEYATAKSNLQLAERIEKKQQIKFTEGLSSSFDFSEAQRQLYTAQQNYLQSMINIINRKAGLETIIK